MNKTLLAAIPLACAVTSVFAGPDPYLEYNCMGLSAPSTEAPVVYAAAAKPALTAVAKKTRSLAAPGMARSTVTGAVGAVAVAGKTTWR
jgi:hypothetical protein